MYSIPVHIPTIGGCTDIIKNVVPKDYKKNVWTYRVWLKKENFL